MRGVQSYIIVGNDAQVLRYSREFTEEEASEFSLEVLRLTMRARHVVRDLDPTDELEVFRLKLCNGVEVLAAPTNLCVVIIMQHWVLHSGEYLNGGAGEVPDAAPAPAIAAQ